MITIGKHLSKYQTKKDYNDNIYSHIKPHISYILNPLKQIIYIPKNKYTDHYFTIVALEDGLTAKLSTNACEYRIDNGEWISLSADTVTSSINSGQKISFKITNPSISLPYGIGTFTISKNCSVQGNIMSLLFGDEFKDKTNLTGYISAFNKLFYNCKTLTDAGNLILSATKLANYCYSNMFSGCTSLTTTPELPATTLAKYCYEYMFHGCTSLTTAPQLPATTLVEYCYYHMFYRCTSLTTAPALSATTLAESCYYSMFSGCTSLTTAPELPATKLAHSCYAGMFYSCTSLTTAPELLATILANYCYWSMFKGCTGLTIAPELPATTLASQCYYEMFSGCSKLNKITMLATDISAGNCLNSWVRDVASTGTFIKNTAMTSLPTGSSGIPEGWTVEDYNESNLITFYISGTEYQAEEGMTWEEWINSEYNTDGYILYLSPNYGDIYDSTTSFVIIYNYSNLKGVESLDLIESNHEYKLGLN